MWFSQWTQIYNLLYLDSGYLILWIQNIGRDNFFDIYDTQGNLLAACVKLPLNEMGFTSKGNYVYSIREVGEDSGGNPLNPIVSKYRVR